MTLHETAQSLFSLSVAGYFNGEKFSLKQLESYIKQSFKGTLKLGNKLVMEIALPDGRWLCEIIHYANRNDGWSYEIPETREEEQRIWNKLIA